MILRRYDGKKIMIYSNLPILVDYILDITVRFFKIFPLNFLVYRDINQKP
jgi:hypothetical protein